ncbi:SH3 domain-containing protein [Pseudomonas granadensis]|uniref:SH3 domain-containing protein n=1 Tax=Pseudomonas granadensis TaxID=1421430 RepID=A0ABX7GMD2_9PSED|nr:SH3 domain-containing protein [Pseudomonas granadensis]MBN6776640.1 SH3 domain-containing protein [Pseudomonas granadensis]MBN6807483.1 SH3 domain-containing protein [Pseudomonas granadensis]MBN6834345.1 SH3 domain-containing protein [Pseudomonas granadensis]MBN6841872.1 SH3 domain-containing protein [Pseudomonas granadensis]MBN6870811.1 SH3 domain-containing protein [Pseudomonas granadensis]
MRKKSQSWFVPLLILFAVLWVIGKKDAPPTQVQPAAQSTPDKLISVPATSTSPTAPPADQYVSTDKLNIRDQPGGKVISRLQRGDKVQVFEKRNEWVRISIDGQPARWLSSKSLCSGSDCYVAPVPKPARATPQPVRSPATEYGSSCSCSSGSVCIGPRGGRYCITSGGKKRYGV